MVFILKQRYLLISLTIVLFLGFNSSIKALSQSQIFVGPPTPGNTYFETESFECSGICQISWDAGHYGANSFFYFYLLQVGEPDPPQASFYGLRGKSFFYSAGTFYFQAYANAGIRSWHIRIEQLSIEQLDLQTTFVASTYGEREVNTEIFRCSGHCTITWTTEYDPSRIYRPANFTFSIKKLGMQGSVKDIDGYCTGPSACYNMNGSADFKESGTFYFSISTYRLDGWFINIEETSMVSEGNYLHIFIGSLFWMLVLADIRRLHHCHSKY